MERIQLPERWDDVRIKITRPGPVDQSGPCANVVPQDDIKAASLPPGNRMAVLLYIYIYRVSKTKRSFVP